MTTFVILGQPTCRYCDEAKKLLTLKDEAYSYLDVTKEPWVLTLLLKANLRSVPQVFAPDGKHIGGYDDLKQFLDPKWSTEDSGVDQHD